MPSRQQASVAPAIIVLIAFLLTAATASAYFSECPEVSSVSIFSAPSPGIFILPVSVLPEKYCVLVNTTVAQYSVYGDVLLVYSQSSNISIADVGCTHPEFTPLALLTGSMESGYVDTVFNVSLLPADSGYPYVESTGLFLARLSYVTPANNTGGYGALVLPSPIQTSGTLSVYAIIRGVQFDDRDYMVIGVGDALVVLHSGNITVYTRDVNASTRFNPRYQQELLVTVASGTIIVAVNGTVLAASNTSVDAVDRVVIGLGSLDASKLVSVYAAIVVHNSPIIPMHSIRVRSVTELGQLIAPPIVVPGKWYLVNYTLGEYAPNPSKVYIATTELRIIDSAPGTPGSRITFNITFDSQLAVAGCLVALHTDDKGVLWWVSSASYHVEIPVTGGETWRVELIVPSGGRGYVIFADGHWKKYDTDAFVLALAGPGYAGCTVTLQIDDQPVFSYTVPDTASTDFLLPIRRMPTPSHIVIQKSVSDTGCTVTITAQTLKAYMVEVEGAANTTHIERPVHLPGYPSILPQVVAGGDPGVMLILVSGVMAMALQAMRQYNRLSSSLILVSLVILALGIIVGGELGYTRIALISLVLLALGLGLKLSGR